MQDIHQGIAVRQYIIPLVDVTRQQTTLSRSQKSLHFLTGAEAASEHKKILLPAQVDFSAR